MSHAIELGLLVFSTTEPENLRSVAARVEQAGFDELWIPEDYFYIGGLTSAAIVLGATEKIPVGIGVLSSVVRHPAVTAMEVATLARAFPGRIRTGIGHGVPFWVAQMGMTPKSPLAAMRSSIENMRSLLAGEKVKVTEGPFVFDDIELVHPVKGPVELYTGVIGPKSLELSGEIAEGTVMSIIAAPKYLEFAKAHIAKGAARSGRDPEAHRLPTFVIYHVDEDAGRAREAARSALAFYLQAVGPTAMTEAYGINDQLREILALGDLDAIATNLPDEWLDTFTIAGTPEQCVAKIKEFHDAGATSVVLAPYPASESDRLVDLTAAEVIPRLRAIHG